MQVKAILKLASLILMILAVFMSSAVFTAFLYGEPARSYAAFLVPIGLSVLFFFLMSILTRKEKVPHLSMKHGFLLVTVTWLLASSMGALPYLISGSIPRFTDAFFESMAGLTTTGLSLIPDTSPIPRSIIFWQSMTHWIGGMGMVVLTVAIFPFLGFGGLNLMKAEVPGHEVMKITAKSSGTAKILWGVYFVFTVTQILLLLLGGMNLFDAVNIAFVTISSGGSGDMNQTIRSYNTVHIDLVVTFFMLLSGINFQLQYKLLAGRFGEVFKDTELKVYLGIFFAGTIVVTYNLFAKGTLKSAGESLRFGIFQVTSILSTTGFSIADYRAWPYFSQFILFILLFIGGCSGSSGGGIKVIRIVTMVKMALNEMKYLIRPRGVFSIFLNEKYLRKNIIYDCSSLVFLYLVIFIIVAFIVTLGGFNLMTSIAISIACVGNTGAGFGTLGPDFSYGALPDFITWTLSFAMLIGRLEIYSVLVLLTPSFWKS